MWDLTGGTANCEMGKETFYMPFNSKGVKSFNPCFNYNHLNINKSFYYIPINDTSFELSAFWPSDTESQYQHYKLRFPDSESISFKTD